LGHHFQYFFEERITTDTPTLDASSKGVAASTTVTFSHTTGIQNNRLLVVAVAYEQSTSSTITVTYGGVALSNLIGTAQDNTVVLLFYLVNPTSGAANVVITDTDADCAVIGGVASTWYNVDQGTPISEALPAAGDNDAGPILGGSVASKTTVEIVIDSAAVTNSVTTMTAQDTQLQQDTAGDLRFGSEYAAGSGTVVLDWNLGAACDWASTSAAITGMTHSYLYAMQGRKGSSGRAVVVNKISLGNPDFGNLETGEHSLTPLTIPGQPVRYQGFWWFPMGDDQKARRLQVVGNGAVSNDTLDATATQLGADHFANLGAQVVATLIHSGNDDGGMRILKDAGDIGAEADWGPAFPLGDRTERSGGLRSLGGLAFALNIEGLYSFNVKARSGLVFEDFRAWRHAFDNIPIVPWKGGLVISHPTGLLFYELGELPVNISLNAKIAGDSLIPSGLTDLRGGRYHGLAPAGDFLWTIYQPDVSSTTVNVMVGYPKSDSPKDLIWQQVGTTTLQDTDHMLGCFVTVDSKPRSAEYVTPTLWYGKSDNIAYVVLGTTASPFRTRSDTHKVITTGDTYMSELRFTEPVDLTEIIVHTSKDMVSGDEFQISLLTNGTGDDIDVGPPVRGSGSWHPRPIDRAKGGKNVTSLVLHVNWVATSAANRVPPVIQSIELYGNPSVGEVQQ
jgi:hypothetical protein